MSEFKSKSFLEKLKESKDVLLLASASALVLSALNNSTELIEKSTKAYDFVYSIISYTDKRNEDFIACYDLGDLTYSASHKSPRDGTEIDNPLKSDMIVQMLDLGIPKEFSDLKYGQVIFDSLPPSAEIIRNEIHRIKGENCAVVYERAFWIPWLQDRILELGQDPTREADSFSVNSPIFVAAREHLDKSRPRGVLPFKVPRTGSNPEINGANYLMSIQQYGWDLYRSFRGH